MSSSEALRIRNLVDPANRLPHVMLVPKTRYDEETLYGSRGFNIHTPRRISALGTKRIGWCQIVTNVWDKERWFTNINVERHKGRGYGMASYLLAITTALDEGYTFRTQNDPCISEDAVRVWQKLADLRIAEEVMPLSETSPGSHVYVGHLRVEPSNPT